jgi:MFS family permease
VRPSLLRLHVGMFAMHFMITATFLAVPSVLVDDLGLASAGHWKVYLAVFVASVAGMVPLVLATERTRRGPALLVFGIVLAAVSQAMLGGAHGHFWVVMAALTLFFVAFNYLEARLPALLTLAAPGAERGAALGIFATAQFLGAFAGGALGGVLLGRFGLPGVFWGAAAVAALWALVAAPGAAAVANSAEHA